MMDKQYWRVVGAATFGALMIAGFVWVVAGLLYDKRN